VPIEQIKVGDWVLSKHESGEGERAYKRVTRTFVHEDKQVIHVGYGGLQADGTKFWGGLVVTPEHPIWVQKKGWKQAVDVKDKWPAVKLELLSDDNPNVASNVRLFVTDKPHIAWLPGSSLGSALESFGGLLDLTTHTFSTEGVLLGFESVRKTKRVKPEHLFRTTVYNIEVEDFHTYYVGKAGVWVHNKEMVFPNVRRFSPAPFVPL
jgi:Pretoxin HINT domain